MRRVRVSIRRGRVVAGALVGVLLVGAVVTVRGGSSGDDGVADAAPASAVAGDSGGDDGVVGPGPTSTVAVQDAASVDAAGSTAVSSPSVDSLADDSVVAPEAPVGVGVGLTAPVLDDRRASRAHLVMDFTNDAVGSLPAGVSLPWAQGDVAVVADPWAADGKVLRFGATADAGAVVAVFDALPDVGEAEVLVRMRSIDGSSVGSGAGVAALVAGSSGAEDGVVVDLQNQVAVGTLVDGTSTFAPVEADPGEYARVRWRQGQVSVRTWTGGLAAEPAEWTAQDLAVDQTGLAAGRIGVSQLGGGRPFDVDWVEVTVLSDPIASSLPRAVEPLKLANSAEAVAVTSTSAVVTWTTNLAATSTVAYGLDDQLGQERSTFEPVTSHEITIPDLVCDTAYRYRIESAATVASDDLSASSPIATFVTAPCEGLAPTMMALTPAPATATVIAGVSTAGLTAPSDRWIKPVASAIWWNDDAQRWDGVLPRGNGEHWLVTGFTDATPTFVTRLDANGQSRPDIAWNEATNDLFVHFTSTSTPTMTRLRYSSGAYTVVTGPVPVPGMRVDDIASVGDNNHPSTIYQTPNGDLWVAVLYLGNLNLQRSKDLGATWLPAPIVVDATISSNGGVVAMADIVQGGTTQLLVFATENVSGRWLVYRIKQNATDLSAANWTNESDNLPAWIGSERSDDHLSVRSYNNRVYVGFKTEGADDPNEPLMGLLVRQPGGTWTRYTSFFTDNGPRESRPGVVIDETNQDVYLFYGMINSPKAGAYKRVPISSLGSLATATETQVFTQANHSDGVVTSRQTVTSASNLAVVANVRSAPEIYRAVLGSPAVAPVISAIDVAVTPTTAVVSWQTDVIATSTVNYGPTSAYGATVTDTNPVTSHQLSLVGLACNTTYHYQISSAASPSGAVGVSPNATFTTAACTVPVAPPVPSGLAVGVVSDTELGVSWTDVAGETSYELEVGPSGGPFVPVPSSPLPAGTVSYAASGLSTGVEYCFRVQASNATGPSGFSSPVCATPVPPVSGVVRIEDSAPEMSFSSGWRTKSSSKRSGGTSKLSSTTGASVSATFQGVAVRLLSTTSWYYGEALVSIDGGTPVRADLYSPAFGYQVPVFEASGLSPGTHTITVTVAGTKNPLSTGRGVDVDALEIGVGP